MQIIRAALAGAVLTRAALTRPALTRAVLTRAALTRAALTRAALTRAAFTRAVLKRAILTGTVYTTLPFLHKSGMGWVGASNCNTLFFAQVTISFRNKFDLMNRICQSDRKINRSLVQKKIYRYKP
jgi:uncharacterized protein YjbI with pentapeptide repeats